MTTHDLRLITKLVQHYRDEASCLTTGEHRGIAHPPERPVREIEVVDLLSDLSRWCAQRGWDMAALLRQCPAR